jgi:glycosyltransferase involved in cell wall biosynthesis
MAGIDVRGKDAKATTLPRITLITPVLNGARTLEQTLRSVLVQDYPNLDYIVIDGGSTDGTVELVQRYEDQLSGWVSEPDEGLFDALNKGFARSTGELMGWINASDMLHQGSLRAVASVFETFPDVEWITGCPSLFAEDGRVVSVDFPVGWTRIRHLLVSWHCIQQESTFWRRSLWERAGGRVDDTTRTGADLELWVRFFRHAHLHPVKSVLAGYRYHDDALGLGLATTHYHEATIEAELASLGWKGRAIRTFRRLDQWVVADRVSARSAHRLVRGLARRVWKKLVRPSVERLSGRGSPRMIRYRHSRRGWIR